MFHCCGIERHNLCSVSPVVVISDLRLLNFLFMDWENAVTVFKGIALFEFKEMKMALLTRTSFSVCFHIPRKKRRQKKKKRKKRQLGALIWVNPRTPWGRSCRMWNISQGCRESRESAGRCSLGCFLHCLWLRGLRKVFSKRGAAFWCQLSCSEVFKCFTHWHSRTVPRRRNSLSLCWALDPGWWAPAWAGIQSCPPSAGADLWGNTWKLHPDLMCGFGGFAAPSDQDLLEFWAGLGLSAENFTLWSAKCH